MSFEADIEYFTKIRDKFTILRDYCRNNETIKETKRWSEILKFFDDDEECGGESRKYLNPIHEEFHKLKSAKYITGSENIKQHTLSALSNIQLFCKQLEDKIKII